MGPLNWRKRFRSAPPPISVWRQGMSMRVIPAIDLKDGRCVRLRQGDMAAETVYSEDVPSVARRWQEQGTAVGMAVPALVRHHVDRARGQVVVAIRRVARHDTFEPRLKIA